MHDVHHYNKGLQQPAFDRVEGSDRHFHETLVGGTRQETSDCNSSEVMLRNVTNSGFQNSNFILNTVFMH